MNVPRVMRMRTLVSPSRFSVARVLWSNAAATGAVSSPFDQRRSMARGARSRKPQAQPAAAVSKANAPPAPALREEDAWTAVTDKGTGGVYYWNEVTNVTTAIGAPKPGSPEEQQMLAQQQQQGQPAQGGLGRAVAEGFSFGVGAGIARAAVGSMFGGFGGGDEGGDGGGDDGDWV